MLLDDQIECKKKKRKYRNCSDGIIYDNIFKKKKKRMRREEIKKSVEILKGERDFIFWKIFVVVVEKREEKKKWRKLLLFCSARFFFVLFCLLEL